MNSLGGLEKIYDKKYLEFVSQALSSSRYYNNLTAIVQDESYYHNEQGQEPDVLFHREKVTQENPISQHDDDHKGEIGEMCRKDLTEENETLFNLDLCSNSSSSEDTERYTSGSCSTSTKRTVKTKKKSQHKKLKQRRNREAKKTLKDFESSSSANNFDLRDIVRSVIEIDTQKQPHKNLFNLADEDLQELRGMYGSGSNTILELEKQQEQTFQKACEKITPTLPKYTVSKKVSQLRRRLSTNQYYDA